MGNYCVYKHTGPNGKVYIGITCQNPLRRWRPDGSGYKENGHFWNAIQLYGWDNFKHEIISSGLSKSQACETEIKLIEKYHSNDWRYGYNRSTGGISPAKGVVWSKDTIRKRSSSLRGRKMSEEHKKKISDAKRGKGNGKNGMFGKKSGNAKLIYQLDDNGNVIGSFYGTNEIGRLLGYSAPQRIGDVCRGTRKRAYGYKWIYAEDY